MASVLASLIWVIRLISLIHTLHFPVGWISSCGSLGYISKTAFFVWSYLLVLFSKYSKGLDVGQSLGVPGYHSLYLLVLVLGTHIQKPFFWCSSIHLIVLPAPKSEPRLFLFMLALKGHFSHITPRANFAVADRIHTMEFI